MPPRVRDKEIKTRRFRASCRSIGAGLIFMLFGAITFSAGLEDILYSEITRKVVILFLIQDYLFVVCGILTFSFGAGYGFFGICQTNVCIRHVLRIGRRTLLHLSHILFIPVVLNLIIGLIGQVLYHRGMPSKFPHGGDPISVGTIWLGFGQSMYKVIYIVFSYMMGIVCIILYWISVFRSSTFFFLLRKGEETKAIKYIHDMKKKEPEITMICSSYHVKVLGYSSAEKREYTTTKERTWSYQQCFDASGPFKIRRDNLFLEFIGLRYVKLRLSWCFVWDRHKVRLDFEKDCEKFMKEVKRDDHAVLEIRSNLNEFENHVMIRLTDSDPFWANLPLYLISSLFGCSLIYRHIFDAVCAEREYKFIKRISSDDILDTNKIYDQSEEFSDSMKAIMNDCPSSIRVSDLPFFTPIPDPIASSIMTPSPSPSPIITGEFIPNKASSLKKEENMALLEEMSKNRKRIDLANQKGSKTNYDRKRNWKKQEKKTSKVMIGRHEHQLPQTPLPPFQSDQQSILSQVYDTFQHPMSAAKKLKMGNNEEELIEENHKNERKEVNRTLFDENLQN